MYLLEKFWKWLRA